MVLNKHYMGVSEGDNTVDHPKLNISGTRTIEEIEFLLGCFNIGDFIPALAWLERQGYAWRLKKLHKRMDEFVNKILADHRTKRELGLVPECDQDLVDVLFDNLEGSDSSVYQYNLKAVVKAVILARISCHCSFFCFHPCSGWIFSCWIVMLWCFGHDRHCMIFLRYVGELFGMFSCTSTSTDQILKDIH